MSVILKTKVKMIAKCSIAFLACHACLAIAACDATGSIEGSSGQASIDHGPTTGGKNPSVDGGVDAGDDPAPPPPDDPSGDAAPTPTPDPSGDTGAPSAADTGSDTGVDAGSDAGDRDGGSVVIDAGSDSPVPPTGDYPSGPYGYATGATFPNVSFSGYRAGVGSWVTISMADYYDPTGSRGINALFVDVSASWCSACRSEASDLPTLAAKYRARGGLIMTALIEDDASDPATHATVDAWSSAFGVTYDIVADGKSDTLGPGGVGLPHNYVIDPRTMTIVQVVEGASGDASLPGSFDTLLSKNGG